MGEVLGKILWWAGVAVFWLFVLMFVVIGFKELGIEILPILGWLVTVICGLAAYFGAIFVFGKMDDVESGGMLTGIGVFVVGPVCFSFVAGLFMHLFSL